VPVAKAASTAAKIERIDVRAYRVPTDGPESDGTLKWDSTTIIVVHAEAEGRRGLGYTYSAAAAAGVVHDTLAERVRGMDAMDIPACWRALVNSIRNYGDSGIAMMAVSAVDAALWDLKARILDVALVGLMGAVRREVPVYGSGGFTSYSERRLKEQIGGWVSEGIGMVKMKIGRDAAADPARIKAAREAIGEKCGLFVDANGGYSRKQALAMAEVLKEYGVSWFEEPVVRHDTDGLRLIRDRAPAGMDITAGEYGAIAADFLRLIETGAVDVLQADATRCGITGFMQAAALCEAWSLPMSSHCAPALHLHPCLSMGQVRHMEYFYDHTRIEHMLFDGAPVPERGMLRPLMDRPGMGLELKEKDAGRYEI